MNHSRWSRKIVALLHDPPDKAFGIADHKDRAAELQRLALGRDAVSDETKRAERADQIASAADRVNFPKGMEAYWHEEKAVLTHPLAGRSLDLGLLAGVSPSETHEATKRAIRNLLVSDLNLKQRFLRLWRLLHESVASEFPRVGALFGMIPADTRQPDHPLSQHLSITAAISDALPQPSLLVFSIGPVQDFIAAARRTQDLWMGSWLLSYLSWAAMKSLAETYGPDVIIFPSLRCQPLCDLWLYEQGVRVSRPDANAIAFASLPNKFVALLPATEAKSAAEEAEKAVCNEWHQLTEDVRKELEKGIMPANDTTRQMWKQQVDTHLEVYWSVLPWEGADKTKSKEQAEAVKTLFKTLCKPQGEWFFDKTYAIYNRSGQYDPNWGTTYSLLYSLADKAFNARKSLRNFTPIEERGEKCTVCGQRSALHGQDGSRKGVRQFWAEIAKKQTFMVKPEGRERLCAVCTVKRFVQPTVLDKKFGLKGGFPSTSTVATASFCARLLEKLSQPNTGELWQAFRAFVEALKATTIPKTGMNLPKLEKLLSQLPPERQKVAEVFLGYDGEWLFEESFRSERLQREFGKDLLSNQQRNELLKKLRQLLEAMKPELPARYYAALHMDGDRAGQWLSGTHSGLTTLGEVLHPKVRDELKVRDEWNELLKERRLMTPSVHSAISEALANFSLKLVRFVIEERHAGRVIYAGGDDLLAFLPLNDVLSAAWELRALFSGEVAFDDSDLKPSEMDLRKKKWKPSFGNPNCTGYLWLDGAPLLTMGPTATASAGIAIAHHLQPLDTTLQAMRQAEETAKKEYDRNALCVYLLKRSGEEMRVGAQWFYHHLDVPQDTVVIVTDICQRFSDKRLAMKFAFAVFDEARTLANLPKEAQQAELKRLLKRHSEGEIPDKEQMTLAERLTALTCALDRHAERVYKRGFEQMSEWLLLARFLAMRGEE